MSVFIISNVLAISEPVQGPNKEHPNNIWVMSEQNIHEGEKPQNLRGKDQNIKIHLKEKRDNSSLKQGGNSNENRKARPEKVDSLGGNTK